MTARRRCEGCPNYLTDPESLRIGYGPVCAGKAGVPHPRHSSSPDPHRTTDPDLLADAGQQPLWS